MRFRGAGSLVSCGRETDSCKKSVRFQKYPGGFMWTQIQVSFRGQTSGGVVCYTAVFSVVTQRTLRDDTKRGCVAD